MQRVESSATEAVITQAKARLATPYGITVEHVFEAAHRLPQLGGKCASLHGHSWRTAITVVSPKLNEDGIVVEFGALKASIRGWIDTNLDHGSMLGAHDPLVQPLREAGSKVFRFGDPDTFDGPGFLAWDLTWPTVEAVAALLFRISTNLLDHLSCAPGTRVARVTVRETHLNAATFEPVRPS